MHKNYYVRNEQERKEFLNKEDGWTSFIFEDVKMFGETYKMCQCEKCKHVDTVREILSLLRPIHCRGCGRVIMKQDYLMFGLENPYLEK